MGIQQYLIALLFICCAVTLVNAASTRKGSSGESSNNYHRKFVVHKILGMVHSKSQQANQGMKTTEMSENKEEFLVEQVSGSDDQWPFDGVVPPMSVDMMKMQEEYASPDEDISVAQTLLDLTQMNRKNSVIRCNEVFSIKDEKTRNALRHLCNERFGSESTVDPKSSSLSETSSTTDALDLNSSGASATSTSTESSATSALSSTADSTVSHTPSSIILSSITATSDSQSQSSNAGSTTTAQGTTTETLDATAPDATTSGIKTTEDASETPRSLTRRKRSTSSILLCPWTYEINVVPHRFPEAIYKAKCKVSQCQRCTEKGGYFEEFSYRMQVLSPDPSMPTEDKYKYIHSSETVPVACVCRLPHNF
uniref:Spaetzle domain-containing protein n=1 Tax=Capitella teleta TaxID=283909 RepID=X1ZYE6_CAPTE